jgi:Ca2+-binding RTX toxin-like protein
VRCVGLHDSLHGTGTVDANVAAGATLLVEAQGLLANEGLFFNGSAETNGRFQTLSEEGDDFLVGGAGNDILSGGDGDDVIFGGAGDDRITGGMGGDFLYGGAGCDIFIYNSAAESTGIFLCETQRGDINE